MKIDEVFPTKYLKASDLPEEGAQPLTIKKIAMEEIGKNKESKLVIYFEELEKAFVCNKTNAKTITKLTGSDDTDNWSGETINLYRAEVEFQGEMVESIRVKLKATRPQSKAVDDDPIPF